MSIVIKKIGNNYYRYSQTSHRENGKVKTISTYLGPVNPRRKRRDGFAFLAFGLLGLGLAAVKGELKAPKAKEKLSSHPRSHLKDGWKPDTLATIQLQARRAGEAKPKEPVREEEVKEWRAFSDRISRHPEAPPAAPQEEATEKADDPDAG